MARKSKAAKAAEAEAAEAAEVEEVVEVEEVDPDEVVWMDSATGHVRGVVDPNVPRA